MTDPIDPFDTEVASRRDLRFEAGEDERPSATRPFVRWFVMLLGIAILCIAVGQLFAGIINLRQLTMALAQIAVGGLFVYAGFTGRELR